MNWKDDPHLQAALAENRVRGGLVRSAIIWTPLFLVALGAFVFFAFDEATGFRQVNNRPGPFLARPSDHHALKLYRESLLATKVHNRVS